MLFLAPVMTARIVLSFFQNILSRIKYSFGFFKDTYIFSELNERSLALAKSLKSGKRGRLIVFTDVFDNNDEKSHELIDRAKKLDAIMFSSDITAVSFKFHNKNSKLYFFIIGEDENENINQAIALAACKPNKKDRSSGSIKHHIYYDVPREDTRIYVFSTKGSMEQNLSALNPKYIKLRRVNDVQSLVYKLLYEDGIQIFNSAVETGNTVFNSATGKEDPEKKISAVIVGLGSYGIEMTKALTWFCQMHPYKLEINAFDKNPAIDSIFHSEYPDLFDVNPAKEELPEPKKDENGEYVRYKFHNGDYTTPGEAHYKISIHTECNCDSFAFDQKLSKIKDATYVFVSLGDDDMNTRVATKIRILMKRLGVSPIIHAIVHNSNKQIMLRNGTTFSGNSYDIRPFGDISTTYSESCVLNSEIEKKALDRHMAYTYKMIASSKMTDEEREKEINAGIESFWKYDYNYRSSVASAIHFKLKNECNIPGIDKKIDDRTEAEKVFIRELEHKRWNAYVRSDGFVYNKVRDKLAKTHHLLVPFKDLPYEEQIKDDD